MKNEQNIKITTEYITLGQLLKFAQIISYGGEEKAYLASHRINVNDVPENRRGKKLRPGDVIDLLDDNTRLTIQ